MAVTFTYLLDHGLQQRQLREDDIAAAEQWLGLQLPRGYRDFVLAHDGPTPHPAWFPIVRAEETTWCGPIWAFRSTHEPLGRGRIGRTLCMEALTQTYRDYNKLPHHYIAIAQLLTRPNTLLLSAGTADQGTVYVWHAVNKRFRGDQLIQVAGSFSEFLGLLADAPADVATKYAQELGAGKNRSGRRPSVDDYDGPEARQWLRRNRNVAALAANHFPSTAAARQFVEELYRLGAPRVFIAEDCIQDHDDQGPYADALVVVLPADAMAREAVCRRCERELDEPETIDADDPNPIFLWWD